MSTLICEGYGSGKAAGLLSAGYGAFAQPGPPAVTAGQNLTVLGVNGQTPNLVDVVSPAGVETLTADASGYVGFGGSGAPGTSADIPFWVSQRHTNPANNSHGAAVTSQRVTTTNPPTVTQTTGLLLQTSTTRVAIGVNDTGRTSAVSAFAWRNDALDAGTLNWSEALEFVYGHGSPAPTAATTHCFGIRLVPCVNAGTVTNLYDLFITARQTGGTVTNHFPIYQQETGLANFFGSALDTTTVSLRSGAQAKSVWACTSTATGAGAWTPNNTSNVVTKTSAYTATAADDVVLADATANAFAVTLPAAAAATGKKYVVKKTDPTAHAVTLASGAGTIDGQASTLLTSQFQTVNVVSNGTNWFVV